VDFVDKEDHFIFDHCRLIDHLLETSFEFSTILRPSDHHREIEGNDTLVSHSEWYFTECDTTRESLDNRGFPDSRISDETWIIFCFSIEYRDESTDLTLTTDHRIDLPITSPYGEILAEKVECWSF
jgi:hypothetical protein